MASFFNLLEGTSQRVLSKIPSSTVTQIEPCSAGIDKINGYFTKSITKTDVIASATLNNYGIKCVFLKDRSEYIEIQNQKGKIHLKLDRTKTFVTGFVTNPNHFNSWCEFNDFFESVTLLADTTEAKISRLDLNLDYPVCFPDFIRCLDITNKRASLTFIDEAGERTGLIIGKGNETIAIYDKAKHANLTTPLTRIEVRLKQTKLPAKTMSELTVAIQNKYHFESLRLINLTYIQTNLKEQITKQDRFKSICDRDGYFLARKSENRTRNFDRDFKNVILVTLNAVQPNEQFKRHIGDFINPKPGGKLCLIKTKDHLQAH